LSHLILRGREKEVFNDFGDGELILCAILLGKWRFGVTLPALHCAEKVFYSIISGANEGGNFLKTKRRGGEFRNDDERIIL